MLVNEDIDISWTQKTRKHFESKGYKFTSYGDKFTVKVIDLPLGSNQKIDVYCDYCLEKDIKTVKKTDYYSYIKSRKIVQKDCCSKCRSKKVKDSNLVKYGVKNVFELDSVKEKSKETQIEKYGVLYSKTEERKEKIKETNIAKYGVGNPMQSEMIRGKAKDTNMSKYGVPNPFSSEEIKEKIKHTISEKYGDGEDLENISQSKHYKEKFKETSLKKFGVSIHLCQEKLRKR